MPTAATSDQAARVRGNLDDSAPGVIFDLDGTLADTIEDIARALNHALRAMQRPTHSTAAVAAMVGEGVFTLALRAMGPAHEAETQRLVDLFSSHYAVHGFDNTSLYAGMAAQLDRIAAAGWPMGILSNKPADFTRQFGESLLGRWSWVAVRGADTDTPRKPDPAAALAITRAMNRPPERVYLVGDSPGDVATARAAGMIAVAAAWGYRTLEQLAAAQPDLIIMHPADLATALGVLSVATGSP